MSNLRSVAATLKPLFENPELAAMSEISEILQALPNDAARLRVMRWSFARFGGEEFKRPTSNLPAEAGLPMPPVVPAQPAYAAVADEAPAIEQRDAAIEAEDIAHQVSELNDLFPSRPVPL